MSDIFDRYDLSFSQRATLTRVAHKAYAAGAPNDKDYVAWAIVTEVLNDYCQDLREFTSGLKNGGHLFNECIDYLRGLFRQNHKPLDAKLAASLYNQMRGQSISSGIDTKVDQNVRAPSSRSL